MGSVAPSLRKLNDTGHRNTSKDVFRSVLGLLPGGLSLKCKMAPNLIGGHLRDKADIVDLLRSLKKGQCRGAAKPLLAPCLTPRWSCGDFCWSEDGTCAWRAASSCRRA